jgi:CubicO group peptidase (beta-lactamase class C family)
MEETSEQQPLTPSGLTALQLSAKITSIIQRGTVPAIGVVVASPIRFEMIVQGVRKQGYPAPVTIDDSFMIGPLSSTLVPIVLARLIERNLFTWSSTLKELLPKLQSEIHPAHHNTTVEELSSHLSGITTKFPDLESGQLSATLISENTSGYEGRRKTLSCLRLPPERKPGPGSSYRNAVNLMILAFVIESVTGERWEAILKREIFEPLGMQHTGIGQPDSLDDGTFEVPNQPWPHEIGVEDKIPVPLEPLERAPWLTCSATFPALGVHSTLPDLITYLQLCLSPTCSSFAPFKNVIVAAARDKLYTLPTGGDFTPGGYDAIRTSWAKEAVLRCKGHVSGFSTGIWIAPETGYAFIVIVNVDGPVGAATRDEVYELIASPEDVRLT